MGENVKLDVTDAVELHEAIAPWEAKTATYVKFTLILGAVSTLGLALGSVIDNTIQLLQGENTEKKRWSCGVFFLAQIWTNITLLFLANHFIQFAVVPWLLITLAGFLFLLLLFNTQETLSTNAICLLRF